METNEYLKLTDKVSKNSAFVKDCFFAFLIGGGICVLGQLLRNLYIFLGISESMAYTLVSVSLVLLSALLTGLGVYDRIARIAGAGTLIPITGFANAVVSPAMEFKTEGLILGLAPKMFVIAGPVILYGTLASVIVGIIFFLIRIGV